MPKTTWIPLLIAVSLGCGSCGSKDSKKNQDGTVPYPDVPSGGAGVAGERNFANLLRARSEGRVNRTPWAGYWWPYLDNGVSEAAAKYESATRSSSALAWEQGNHGAGVPGIESWWGHCNGWAAAAILTPEPRESVEAGGVSFGIADRKALLSEIGMEVAGSFFGQRAETSSNTADSAFQDVHPNQFFLVLTNFVGTGFPMIMDRFTGLEVWNHPVAGYRVEPVTREDDLGPHPSASHVHRAEVTLRVWWVRDDVAGDHQTEDFSFRDSRSFQSRVLRFEAWLDGPLRFNEEGSLVSSGNVILSRSGSAVLGGAWRNTGLEFADSHPDYLWVATDFAASSGFSNPHLDHSFVRSRLATSG